MMQMYVQERKGMMKFMAVVLNGLLDESTVNLFAGQQGCERVMPTLK